MKTSPDWKKEAEDIWQLAFVYWKSGVHDGRDPNEPIADALQAAYRLGQADQRDAERRVAETPMTEGRCDGCGWTLTSDDKKCHNPSCRVAGGERTHCANESCGGSAKRCGCECEGCERSRVAGGKSVDEAIHNIASWVLGNVHSSEDGSISYDAVGFTRLLRSEFCRVAGGKPTNPVTDNMEKSTPDVRQHIQDILKDWTEGTSDTRPVSGKLLLRIFDGGRQYERLEAQSVAGGKSGEELDAALRELRDKS